jgi:hypothetical protein
MSTFDAVKLDVSILMVSKMEFSERKYHHDIKVLLKTVDVRLSRVFFYLGMYLHKAFTTYLEINAIFEKSYHLIPWLDSISRPIAPVSSVSGSVAEKIEAIFFLLTGGHYVCKHYGRAKSIFS